MHVGLEIYLQISDFSMFSWPADSFKNTKFFGMSQKLKPFVKPVRNYGIFI